MSGLVVGSALVLGGTAGLHWWQFARCRSCRPRCPSKHVTAIAGNQGIVFASTLILLAALLEYLL